MQEKKKQRYPVGIQSFSEIRERDYLYVDKTAYLSRLLEGKYFFLSRPRRFGKSLLLSTLEAYFKGKRELFKGLALDSLAEDWAPRPVLRLDLNNGRYEQSDELNILLSYNIGEWEREFELENIADASSLPVGIRFGNLIKKIYEKTGKKVVILVDEYDKPLLNVIEHPEIVDDCRSILKSFYTNLKTMDEYIEFAMLTGVARFSKVSIFSDLNNLRDISFENEFAGICGITSDELDEYFKEGIEELAKEEIISPEDVRAELKKRYDGYHFSRKSPDIYNPFSLVNAFAKKNIGDYWFETGTPTFLVKVIRKLEIPLKDVAPVRVESRFLETAGVMNPNPVALFYQSGYLTIKSYDSRLRTYTLDYPNEEVKQGFLSCLMEAYLPQTNGPMGFSITEFINDILTGNVNNFMERMGNLLAGMPYNEKGTPEARFQDAAYLLFTLTGFFARMEQRTSDGRIDITLETESYVYIFEFKIDSSAKNAMEQIKEKKYWQPFASTGKEIFLIGANFDTTTRKLSEYVVEVL